MTKNNTQQNPESMPSFMSLNSGDLITWCRSRKRFLNLSNAKLAELSGVPIGTIDRIMTGGYHEYKYSSIQPIVSVLIGQQSETPRPKMQNDSQEQYYFDTIEGYKMIVDHKNQLWDNLKNAYDLQKQEVEYLRQQIRELQILLQNSQKQIEWLQHKVDEKHGCEQ